MKYFSALREGQRRVAKSLEYLRSITNDSALPALALRDTKDSSWDPVGDETFYTFMTDAPGYVLQNNGYLLALVDNAGTAKALVQNITSEQKEKLEKTLKNDGITRYDGKVSLPV